MDQSWCNKLASTPVVGITLSPRYVSSGSIGDAFAPLLNKAVDENGHPTFQVDPSQNFSFSFTTNNGFVYGVEPNKTSVSFVHRMKAVPVSAGLPRVEMLSEARPYTELLDQVIARLIEAVMLLPSPKGREVLRIGIVSKTDVSEEDAPPGIRNFIDHLSAPWGGNIDDFSVNIVGVVSETPKWTDRCVHQLVRAASEDALTTLLFDWQRSYEIGHALNKNLIAELLADAKDSALAYFEDVAEGRRFDVD